jgi:hypothetical protein
MSWTNSGNTRSSIFEVSFVVDVICIEEGLNLPVTRVQRMGVTAGIHKIACAT